LILEDDESEDKPEDPTIEVEVEAGVASGDAKTNGADPESSQYGTRPAEDVYSYLNDPALNLSTSCLSPAPSRLDDATCGSEDTRSRCS
jgi:hypothetical protein